MAVRAPGERVYSLAGIAGIVLAVLIALQVILAGAPPSLTDSTQKVSSYLSDKAGVIPTNAFLHGLSLFVAAFFFAGLIRRIAESDRVLATAVGLGAAVGGALVTVAIAIGAALSYDALSGLAPEAQQSLFVTSTAVQIFAAFAFAAASAATALAILWWGGFDRWLGWLSALSAVLWLVSGLGVMTDANVFLMLGLVALIVWLVWIVALGLALRKPALATPVT